MEENHPAPGPVKQYHVCMHEVLTGAAPEATLPEMLTVGDSCTTPIADAWSDDSVLHPWTAEIHEKYAPLQGTYLACETKEDLVEGIKRSMPLVFGHNAPLDPASWLQGDEPVRTHRPNQPHWLMPGGSASSSAGRGSGSADSVPLPDPAGRARDPDPPEPAAPSLGPQVTRF